MAGVLSAAGQKRVLLVLFIPSVERDGVTAIDQDRWTDTALEFLGRVFGGATAYPRARGVWRDDEAGGRLVFDEPVVMHCYTEAEQVEDEENLRRLGEFCRRLGRETKQGEVGLVIGDVYFPFREFGEEG